MKERHNVFESCSTRLPQHQADSNNSDTGHKVLTARGWFYNFVYHVLLATFCGSRSVGSLKLVTCINDFCGCSHDVYLIVSQEATA